MQLKLYTRHSKVTAIIDDSYTAYSHSVDTLINWYDNNTSVGRLAVSSQVVFPIFVTLYVVLFFVYILELKPHNFGRKISYELESEIHSIRAEAQSRLLTQVTISILLHILTLIADSVAMAHYSQIMSLPDNVKYYYSNKLQNQRYYWSVPIIMITFDGITFVLLIIVPLYLFRKSKYRYRLTYCLISPFSCLASHAYHIVFAFIHNPYHASSILLLYAIVIFVHIQGFKKFFYFVNSLAIWKQTDNCDCTRQCNKKCSCSKCDGGESDFEFCRCSCIKQCCNTYSSWILKQIGLGKTTTCFYIMIELLLMMVSIGISLALIILLPISNAIYEAPNRLYIIYQASVTFFAGLITFRVLFSERNESIFGLFVRAMAAVENLQPCPENINDITLEEFCKDKSTKNWKNMSDKEKEFYLANEVLSKFIPDSVLKLSPSRQSPGGPSTGGPSPGGPSQGGSSTHNSLDEGSESSGGFRSCFRHSNYTYIKLKNQCDPDDPTIA